ncbi:MAG: HAD family phosphatase [Lachnospiraceae bacterium]|nr:HAD family phosphatase [Lachnospiraceae bacterium]
MMKNIIFDIGNVLASFRWKALFQELGFTGEKFDRIAAATVLHPTMWNEFDRSLMRDEEIISCCIEREPEYEADIRRLFASTAELVEEYSYSFAWIKELKDRGYRVYLLSNYGKTSFEAAREKNKLSFLPLVDGAVISYEVQMVKPEAGIYKALLEKYKLAAEECVFLDDKPENVAAAQRLGFHGIVVESGEQARKTLEEKLQN